MSLVTIQIPDPTDPDFNRVVKLLLETPVPLELPSYSVQELINLTATLYEGQLVTCSNGDGGSECLAYCDGFVWKRIVLGNEISLTELSSSGESLPDQSGHSGEFLTTDGSDASWASIPGGGDLLSTNNLSDVTSAATALNNIGGEPADATILKEADVDDVPVNGVTDAPVSSNWAYDHADTHAPSNADNTAANETSHADVLVDGDVGVGAGKVCAGDDSRLSDSRTPTAHDTSHENGGGDEISVAGLSGLLADDQHVLDAEVVAAAATVKIDDFAAPDDNTDLNVSTSAHGLCPKLSNVSTEFLNGQGSFSTPAGGSTTPIIVLSKSTSDSQNVGGADGTEVWWTWDGEIIKDTGFTHSTVTNSGRIQVDADGRYKISFMGNAQQTGSSRTTLQGVYRINGGSTLRSGTIRSYSRGSSYGNLSPGLVNVVELTNGDYIEVGSRVEDTDASYTITAASASEIGGNECRLIIEKIP